MIGVGINSWDDPKGLLTILDDKIFYDFIDVFYVIEGRYSKRNDKPEYDTKVIQAICSKFSKCHFVEMYDVKQIEKRNKYWELAEKDNLDWMIVLDTDEYCKVEPDILSFTLKELDQYQYQCYPILQWQTEEMSFPRPRLFKKPFNFRHRQNTKPGRNISHGSLYDEYGRGEREIINTVNDYLNRFNRESVKGITMYHDKKYRSVDRVKADYVYYNNVPDR